jgi:hypothetical protein
VSVSFFFFFEQLFLRLFCLFLFFFFPVGNIVGVERDKDGSGTASRATESG